MPMARFLPHLLRHALDGLKVQVSEKIHVISHLFPRQRPSLAALEKVSDMQ